MGGGGIEDWQLGGHDFEDMRLGGFKTVDIFILSVYNNVEATQSVCCHSDTDSLGWVKIQNFDASTSWWRTPDVTIDFIVKPKHIMLFTLWNIVTLNDADNDDDGGDVYDDGGDSWAQARQCLWGVHYWAFHTALITGPSALHLNFHYCTTSTCHWWPLCTLHTWIFNAKCSLSTPDSISGSTQKLKSGECIPHNVPSNSLLHTF